MQVNKYNGSGIISKKQTFTSTDVFKSSILIEYDLSWESVYVTNETKFKPKYNI